jgi:hypothetical protein
VSDLAPLPSSRWARAFGCIAIASAVILAGWLLVKRRRRKSRR